MMTDAVSKVPSQAARGDDAVPVPLALAPKLSRCALLLDIDGTLLDLAPTPDAVVVPPGLTRALRGLHERTSGALALGIERSRLIERAAPHSSNGMRCCLFSIAR